MVRDRVWKGAGCGKGQGVVRERVWKDSGCECGKGQGVVYGSLFSKLITFFYKTHLL